MSGYEIVNYRDCRPKDAWMFPRFAEQIACETNFTLHSPGKQFVLEKIEKRWKEAFDSSSEFYLGAFSNDKSDQEERLVGQLYFHLIHPTHPKIKHIGEFSIMILKQYWGEGIARHMMETMEERAKKMGVSRIEAKVLVGNHRAVAFYERLGYKSEGIRQGSINVNGTLCDEYYIAKLLEE